MNIKIVRLNEQKNGLNEQKNSSNEHENSSNEIYFKWKKNTSNEKLIVQINIKIVQMNMKIVKMNKKNS